MTFTIAERIEYLLMKLNKISQEGRAEMEAARTSERTYDVVSKARERVRKKRILRKKIKLLKGSK